MTNKFAKTFQHPLGQVLIVKDINDEGKFIIRATVQPKGCHLSSIEFLFGDGEQSEEIRDKVFVGINKKIGVEMGNEIFTAAGAFVEELDSE